MTTQGSDENRTVNEAAGRQGILSFFQNTTTQEKPIEVIESEDDQPNGEQITKQQPEAQSLKGKSSSTGELVSTKKQEAQKEKERRKRQREEEKRRREQEREDEKRRREEQKEEEKRKREKRKEDQKEKREELKRRKESEKRQREEEKLKKEQEKKLKQEAKERSQARIGNFFKKVSDSSKQLNVASDYEKFFLPFYAKESVSVNITIPFSHSKLDESKNRIDMMLKRNDDDVTRWLAAGQGSIKPPQQPGYTAVTLLQQMTSKEATDEELKNLLSLIPQKYIKFYENVRPPYMGTYSKSVLLPADDPFSTKDTGYNYDYDSDLEWINEEDEEEGGGVDNLESGEEDEDEEDEEPSEGEFDGFLDAEDNINNLHSNKRKFIGPLIPTVCLRTNQDTMQEDDRCYFDMVSVQYLMADQSFPIDPLHYIKPNGESHTAPKGFSSDSQHDSYSSSSVSPEKKKAKSLISEPKDLLKLFDEVQDSTFSLGTVTEIAQKNLPFYSKQTIKNTVKQYAARSSVKGETARKWMIKDKEHWGNLRSSYDNN
ncbi:related to Chromatin assembly factor 1 subunit p90 [Zygosaccharomyces bailii]|uniref:ZYBA0S06-02784g1_1 n=1 Tax=Zygosaccharomyces bailii (strain CLIB 213 / ATCC 58445 / CBS 680 / BCRC 21525 / NBRC 1098 / NCYC 1416 / NRRL Y-2227) TaxID=1333698 RepID=A0A8J2X8V7_ZYGB2|nr:ZYBA0S06-02784g1_1 [Zygosaccharomyces bailii CLIB 213]CDH11585.1 related to Chromatin assembly factor 1 subunit p90 [Zygosaccharomyces bailii ISA1307]SJM87268.1 related to Chromatin assembly factor 1 subunit p90 [Zygosaccharomyces bailii]